MHQSKIIGSIKLLQTLRTKQNKMKTTLCVVMLTVLFAAVVLTQKCTVDSDCFGLVNCTDVQDAYCHFLECHCHAVHECHNPNDCNDECPIGSSPTCDNNHCHC